MNVLTTNSGGAGEQVALLTQQGDTFPVTVEPQSSGSSTPLSSVLYVDVGNAGTGTPNGSIDAPFLSIQAAIDASSALLQVTIYVAPGNYAEAPTISAPGQVVNLIGMTSGEGYFDDPNQIDPVTITGLITGSGANLSLEELTFLAVSNPGGAVKLSNAQPTNNAINVTCSSVEAWTNRGYRLRANVGTGVIVSEGYQVFEAHCGSLSVTRSPGGMGTLVIGTASPNTFISTDWSGAGATIDPAAIFKMDLFSYESAIRAGVALPLDTTVIGSAVRVQDVFDSQTSPHDQTVLPANHAPGVYNVGFALTVTAAGAHTVAPTVLGSGESGAFAIGNNPAWTDVDTSATKTVGFAPVCVYSDGTTALVVRWTWDSTGGDIAGVTSDAAAFPQGSGPI